MRKEVFQQPTTKKLKPVSFEGLFLSFAWSTVAPVAAEAWNETPSTLFTLIAALPSYAVGITAQGRITKDDYEETLLPAPEKAAGGMEGINFLFVMKTDFAHFTFVARLSDLKANAPFFRKRNKVAVVAENDGLDLMTKAFSLIAPGETKVFLLTQLSMAKECASAP